MKSLFGGMFDFDGDGCMDNFERAAECMFLSDVFSEDKSEDRTELELSGLDPDELEFMDSDERRAVLEDAGLDPHEYDF